MKASFFACLVNVMPMLVYSLIGLVLAIVASIPVLPRLARARPGVRSERLRELQGHLRRAGDRVVSAPSPSSGRRRHRRPAAPKASATPVIRCGSSLPDARRARAPGTSSTSSSWTCSTSFVASRSRADPVAHGDHRELDEIGRRALHRRIDRRALGAGAARSAAGVDVGQPQPPSEHRFDIAVLAREFARLPACTRQRRDSCWKYFSMNCCAAPRSMPSCCARPNALIP